MTVSAAILKKNRKIASLTDRNHHTLCILPNKTANIIKQNWNQFLLYSYKSHRYKTANIKILSANSKHMTGVCALNLRIKS